MTGRRSMSRDDLIKSLQPLFDELVSILIEAFGSSEHGSKIPRSATLKRWVTPTEAAALIGVTAQTLANWRCSQKKAQPRFYQSGPKSVRYLRKDVEAWIECQKVQY